MAARAELWPLLRIHRTMLLSSDVSCVQMLLSPRAHTGGIKVHPATQSGKLDAARQCENLYH